MQNKQKLLAGKKKEEKVGFEAFSEYDFNNCNTNLLYKNLSFYGVSVPNVTHWLPPDSGGARC